MLDHFISLAKQKLVSLEDKNDSFQTGSRPAAVLFPIILHKTPTVLFTQRSLNLPNHAGQIGLVGGKLEKGETPLQAALRETDEEIGLKSSAIKPFAQMPPKLTRTGFEIVAVLATVEPNFTLHLNSGEVDSVFEVPLEFLMDERNMHFKSRLFWGRERFFHAIPYKGHYIWGVTASLIQNLHERLYHDAA